MSVSKWSKRNARSMQARIDALMNRTREDRHSICGACGHATAHDETEYEDTHSRCGAVTKRTKYACDAHEPKFNADCSDCFVSESRCDCPLEYKIIAKLLVAS